MKRVQLGVALLLALAGLVAAQEALPLLTAQGIVEKVDKDTLTIQPRGEGGKFSKPIALKLTGTSKITTFSLRDKKTVVQREIDAKELRPKQSIAVTYTTTKDGNVLLTAVVQAAEK
jgi:hypothetical protein